ncbi:uncharacterized protein TRAVEDRAFT_110233 [Trametes versicolor FP-101664 SS1]|uniref:uncharacterized protein n=1 Tax=Trametes versicolor (strain FP-101664) TaxID=717944 RepID=UPI0004622C96|nr:uncharacterized protein TRAVEDRAFT_110233 [Trametes versicolor FP-101664 SS1]EIW64897.1 hypothetical protein TRAVEDRAFT_110233 [Trametes versicolor FP-101664 SS1]
MAPSVSSALGDLLQSLAAIGASLLNSVFAVFQALLALIQELVGSVLQLAQTLFAFAANLLQGAVGFVVANFFAVALVGGGYYWYTHRDGRARTRSGGKRIA